MSGKQAIKAIPAHLADEVHPVRGLRLPRALASSAFSQRVSRSAATSTTITLMPWA
jgi:hypothetical protein